MIISRDTRSIVYEKLSLSDLIKMRQLSKSYRDDIDLYFNLLFNNPDLFFTRLAKESHIGDSPIAALIFLNKFQREYLSESNDIKLTLEHNHKFIVSLFNQYAFDSKAITIITNTVARIASPEKLRAMWQSGFIPDYYYLLITDDTNEVSLQDAKKHFTSTFMNSKNGIPIPIQRALDVFDMSNPDQKLERSWDSIASQGVACFPLNLSRTTRVNCYNLTCAIIRDVSVIGELGLINGTITLVGAYVDVSLQHDMPETLCFQDCDLRYAYLSRRNNSNSEIQIVSCNVSSATLSNLRIKASNLFNSYFYGAVLKDISCEMNLFQENIDEPEIYFSIKSLLTMSMKGLTLIMSHETNDTIAQVIHRIVEFSMTLLKGEISDASNLNILREFDDLLITKRSIIKSTLQELDDGTAVFSDTPANKNNFILFVQCLKKKSVELMLSPGNPTETEKAAIVRFLQILDKLKSTTSVFDDLDNKFHIAMNNYINTVTCISEDDNTQDKTLIDDFKVGGRF